MKTRTLVLLLGLAQLLAIPATAQRIIADRATIQALTRTLVAGGELYYPAEAARANLGGKGKFGMNLGKDGGVVSVTVVKSTGVPVLDRYMQERLMTYRFHPGNWSPVVFAVEFIPPKEIMRARNLTHGF